ncbi:hypothetical protein MUK42_08094 [Musa troglodytarum]|uniref:Uncharacterized protein n=1 Tax=Musa troglodytarum TaxID=320322 RepID=A0A9E7HMK2_9LILI|nr:hypothetical protein MUK42_08094 [Musa troglodytarum]
MRTRVVAFAPPPSILPPRSHPNREKGKGKSHV